MNRQTQNVIVGGLAFLVAVLGMLVVVNAFVGDDSETAAIDPLSGGAVEAGNSTLTTAPPATVNSSVDVDAAAAAARTASSTAEPLAPVVTAPTTAAPITKAPTTPVPTTAAPVTEAPTTVTTEAKADDSMPAASDGADSAGETDPGKTDPTPATDPPKSDDTAKPETTQPPAEPDPTTSATEATTAATNPPSAPTTGLTGVEQEIIRLTNELRADPDGPLKRQKPMPSCVSDSFYGIQMDSSNHPQAVPTLQVNESVSIQMARDWSFQMNQADRMYHRPGDSAKAKYAELGINYRAYGENVAWGSGYAESAIARVFFEGWRESDTGHYCAMVAPIFTHFGVGHYRNGGLDWSTQNFYTLG